jgi:hypothetical protein
MKNNFSFLRNLIFCLIPLLLSASSYAQEMALPVEDQVPLFIKILNYERNLKNYKNDIVVIGVIYQERFRISNLAKDAFIKTIDENSEITIDGKPVDCVPIEISNIDYLENIIIDKKIKVLYVAPLRSIELSSIYRVSRQKKVVSITGVSRYVKDGLSVGLDLIDERPKILINLKAAKYEGTDFTSQLLRLAIIIN